MKFVLKSCTGLVAIKLRLRLIIRNLISTPCADNFWYLDILGILDEILPKYLRMQTVVLPWWET